MTAPTFPGWTAETLADLRARWEAGEVASAIAAAMGTSKGSVIGKANRLGLTARPSPIRNFTPRAKSDSTRVKRSTGIAKARNLAREGYTPEQIAKQLGVHLDTARGYLREAGVSRRPGRPSPKTAPVTPVATHPALRYGTEGCRWPYGEPRKPGFRFCCDVPVQGRPYCAAHCRVAYVQPGAGESATHARVAL